MISEEVYNIPQQIRVLFIVINFINFGIPMFVDVVFSEKRSSIDKSRVIKVGWFLLLVDSRILPTKIVSNLL